MQQRGICLDWIAVALKIVIKGIWHRFYRIAQPRRCDRQCQLVQIGADIGIADLVIKAQRIGQPFRAKAAFLRPNCLAEYNHAGVKIGQAGQLAALEQGDTLFWQRQAEMCVTGRPALFVIGHG